MTERQTSETTETSHVTRGYIALLVVSAGLFAGLLVLGGGVLLLAPDGWGGSLGEVNQKVQDVKGPATGALVGFSGLGLLAGGAMTALGMQQGVRIMTMAGLAAGGVVLGNAIVA